MLKHGPLVHSLARLPCAGSVTMTGLKGAAIFFAVCLLATGEQTCVHQGPQTGSTDSQGPVDASVGPSLHHEQQLCGIK